ncbi:ABC transporter ATP-binding protein [Marinobacter goseongensis]|uniref:ABC transporter ATP-binding protein n=1 Tax=Marinobacter goseongensis TaxID=453838 RepID=UPI002002D9B8|nr:ABC transporter ATP-binding protein [Marinobacter goseongensis]MCK7550350.1 ABC transporter ATP-binding protein [Marinobacter goseongensis]
MTSETSMPPDGSAAVRTRDLIYRWPKSHTSLHFPDLELNAGSHLFIKGASGSGKSTLLSLLGGMLRPASGSISLLGRDLGPLSNGQRDRFRADHMGVIFQQFNLVPYLSTLANVTLPCRLSPQRQQRTHPSARAEATALLRDLAIPESHWQQPVGRLSVGQQQRVAAARALIGQPELILADEPTSALDADNRDRFIDVLLTLAHRSASSVIFVSHDRSLARHFDQELVLEVCP